MLHEGYECCECCASDTHHHRRQYFVKNTDYQLSARSPLPAPPTPRQNNDKFKNDCPEGTKNCACWMAKNKYGGFMGPYAMTNVDANL